jgi:hypothetical protein
LHPVTYIVTSAMTSADPAVGVAIFRGAPRVVRRTSPSLGGNRSFRALRDQQRSSDAREPCILFCRPWSSNVRTTVINKCRVPEMKCGLADVARDTRPCCCFVILITNTADSAMSGGRRTLIPCSYEKDHQNCRDLHRHRGSRNTDGHRRYRLQGNRKGRAGSGGDWCSGSDRSDRCSRLAR